MCMQHFKSNQYAAVVHTNCLQQYNLNLNAADKVSGQLQLLNAANKKNKRHPQEHNTRQRHKCPPTTWCPSTPHDTRNKNTECMF